MFPLLEQLSNCEPRGRYGHAMGFLLHPVAERTLHRLSFKMKVLLQFLQSPNLNNVLTENPEILKLAEL